MMVMPTLVLRLKAIDVDCDFIFQGKILSSSDLTQTLNVGQVLKNNVIFRCSLGFVIVGQSGLEKSAILLSQTSRFSFCASTISFSLA